MEASLFHGTLPFIMENPAVSRGGRGMLDSFRARLLCGEDWETDARTLGFEIDRKLTGFHSLWVKAMEPDEQAEGVVIVEVTGEGLKNTGDRRTRRLRCGERQTSVGPHEKVVIVWSKEERGEDPAGGLLDKVPRRSPKLDEDGETEYKTISTPSGNMDRWVVSEAEVSLIDTYFTTTKPSMAAVGGVFVPDNAPEVPDYQWTDYGEAMRGVHPNGWILADRDVEEIFKFSETEGLWRVADTVLFRHPSFPD